MIYLIHQITSLSLNNKTHKIKTNISKVNEIFNEINSTRSIIVNKIAITHQLSIDPTHITTQLQHHTKKKYKHITDVNYKYRYNLTN